jgi:phosphohistidine swiveling domain-containing protein
MGGIDPHRVRARPIPETVRAAIAEAYAGLGGGPVAVRSSATAEDLPRAAFAGQQDTFLDVLGEQAVLDAVRRCWGSLWTDRAMSYRRRLGIDNDEISIAVVVQRMVSAELAGVMFTANPVTGDRADVVIDVGRGLGEAVVSGTVIPDHYVVDGGGAVREKTLGAVDLRDSGSPADLRRAEDSLMTDLAVLGRSVAEHFGRPQDIEWAHADGRTWLLQARPMTALPPPPLRLNGFQRRIGQQLLDYITVRPYPLDMSAWIGPGIGRLVERMLAEIPGLRVEMASMLPESDGVVDRFVPPSPRPTRALLTAPIRLLPRIRRYHPTTWTDDARFARFELAVAELDECDLTCLDWTQLCRVPRRALAVTDVIADLRVDYLPRVGVDLLRLRALLMVLGLTPLFPLLILGGQTRTEDANRALEELAARVTAEPALKAAFTAMDPATLLERIEQDAGFAGFRTALHLFRSEYGHRETTSLLLMSAPTLGEDLTTVLLEAGNRLVAAGVLRDREEVLHLRLEELEAIPDPLRLAPDDADRLRALARQRSARRAELAGVPLIATAGLFPAQESDQDVLVSGVAASAGRAGGTVRIVRKPQEFATLRSGEILVCPYTNPSWTPLFQRAAAVAVDSGGLGSHAAIVAREYGIPAVMGTGNGTTRLRQGQVVTVDGGTGRVRSADDMSRPHSR